ncbi:mechanosensitive ion channel family protein [Nitratidesulfovibrio vulgaris]|uniref:mechanosensitive ion channel family protein n=1 Tax=Nitratidesulfovibrio vulgaris TaxID=881 RepID=UPI002301DCAD|nr:mechanosensitive ion channel domain-containing protein [Nitratidesulfovibrio vulgaris]WCB45088.1 mechanosensitive ion channel [Nitratidesulfovibrio vulgaris]
MQKHHHCPLHISLAPLATLLLLIALLMPGIARADDETQPPAEIPTSDAWGLIWQDRTQELVSLLEESEALRKDLPATARKLDADISGAQREYQRLFALFQASRSLPSELVAINGHLLALERGLQKSLSPLQTIHEGLETKFGELESAEKELVAQLPRDRSDLAAELTTYLNNLSQGKRKLASLRSRLSGVIEPGKVLLGRIATTRGQIETMLPDLWRRHYLEPSSNLFDVGTWNGLQMSVETFIQNAPLRLATEMPTTPKVWIGCALRFLFIFVPVLIFGRMLARRETLRQALPDNRWKRLTNRSMVWIGIGLALHFASWNSGEVFRAIVVPANIFLIWGQLTLAWELRALHRPGSPRRSPFQPLFAPVLASLLLLFLNPPLVLLGPVWSLVLLIALWHSRKRQRHGTIPPLEANMVLIEPFMLWLSLVVTLFGWGRLAILLYMAYLAIAVSLQLGLALMRLLDDASARLPREGASAILGGVILGITAPLVLLLVAGALVLWVIAYPGGSYILRHAIEFNFKVGEVSFDGLRILFILTAFYVTRSLVAVGSTFLVRLPQRMHRFDRSMVQPMQTAFTYLLWALFGLYVLNALGVSLTNLAVIAGGLSVGIGFGLQTIVNNFISGLILIFGRTLQEGDIIDLGGTMGTVRKVSIRATTVETFDNAVIFVPNADLVSNRLTNWTRNSLTIRRDVAVGVAYGSDVELVTRLLLEVAKAHKRVLHHPGPVVLFDNFGPSSLDFILRVWVDDIAVGVSTASDLRVEIDRVFRENNVEISFPQLDLHVRSAEGLQPLTPGATTPTAPSASGEA